MHIQNLQGMKVAQWMSKLEDSMMWQAYAITEDKDLTLDEMDEVKDYAVELFETFFQEGKDEEEAEREETEEESD